ncbi:DUF3684 domain-containing protein [Leisingera sp. S132]|uniref:DUF3684 domain-containing protein n=1 Tax=Leisingera sp. S132 TaxID=2867016 RepID=UPI0021A581CC|nr:DUF3684 domain-containing protein [Leisingera sp. S132]UWQ79361.1 DUF3684 domain-containing protein [Leisingera sp. S132]
MPDNYIFFGPHGLFQRAAAAGCKADLSARALVKLRSMEIVPLFCPAGRGEFGSHKMRMVSCPIPVPLRASQQKFGSVYNPACPLTGLRGRHFNSSVKSNERGVTCA